VVWVVACLAAWVVCINRLLAERIENSRSLLAAAIFLFVLQGWNEVDNSIIALVVSPEVHPRQCDQLLLSADGYLPVALGLTV